MSNAFVDGFAEHAPDMLARLPGSGLDWLDAARRAQLDAFVRDGLPDGRNEAWKYTALRALARRAFMPGDSAASTRELAPQSLDLPGVDGPRLVFLHGVFRPDLSRLDELPKGLTLQPLAQALDEDPEPLRFLLARSWERTADAFARLNAALAGDGMVLRVAPGATIEVPVHLVHAGVPTDTECAWHARQWIEVGEDARVSLVEHHIGEGVQHNLGTVVSDVQLRTGARLDWVALQDAASEVVLVRRDDVQLEAGAQLRMHALELGAGLGRREFVAELRGAGARLETRGVFVPRARQHLDTRLDIRHRAGGAASDALWRGVADQRGRGVFHGAISVDAGADGSQATLANKNLLLSPHAEIDTQPVLEIHADEVVAAHGATVGQLDERALFYLRSRGLPEARARTLLTVAFCRAALEDLGNAALREHLGERLVARLPADGETA